MIMLSWFIKRKFNVFCSPACGMWNECLESRPPPSTITWGRCMLHKCKDCDFTSLILFWVISQLILHGFWPSWAYFKALLKPQNPTWSSDGILAWFLNHVPRNFAKPWYALIADSWPTLISFLSFVLTDENENRVEYETKIIFYLNILDDNDRKAFSLWV